MRALVRNAGTSNAAKAAELTRLANVEIVEGDLSQPATLVPALDGVDRAMLISSSDASMRDVQFNLIDAAASVTSSRPDSPRARPPTPPKASASSSPSGAKARRRRCTGPWKPSSGADRLDSTSSPGATLPSSVGKSRHPGSSVPLRRTLDGNGHSQLRFALWRTMQQLPWRFPRKNVNL
jgi:hypothetical protein